MKASGDSPKKKSGTGQSGPTASATHDDVPLLTEIVARAVPAGTASALSASDLREIEQRLIEIVVPVLSKVIGDSLKSRLEEQLRKTFLTLVEQSGTEIESLIRDAVARAVKSEVARLREPSRNKPA